MVASHNMIYPFVSEQCRTTPTGAPAISFGLSSCGYDLRLASEYKIFTNARCAIVDPKNFDIRCFVHHEGEFCLIPPTSFVLGRSVERLQMPPNVLGLCIGKSTMARVGLVVNVTPIEPSWNGRVTIEISNTTPLPAKVYSNEGICQVLFLESDGLCDVTYEQRGGKYQNQVEITLPIV